MYDCTSIFYSIMQMYKTSFFIFSFFSSFFFFFFLTTDCGWYIRVTNHDICDSICNKKFDAGVLGAHTTSCERFKHVYIFIIKINNTK